MALGGAVLALLAAAAPAAAVQTCDVTIHATGPQPLGGLQVLVDYALATGGFEGAEDAVSCTPLAAGAYSEARNDVVARELGLGMISAIGVAMPADLWRCTFIATGAPPDAGDFSVAVEDAVAPDASPATATATITSIVCAEESDCGNGKVEGLEECDTSGASDSCTADCQLTRNSQRCGLTFRASGAGTLGGLQFEVGYAGAGGQFEGSGIGVACSEALESSLTAKEDRDADKTLALALVSPSGLSLPADLWECVFTTNASLLKPQAFTFDEVEAVDTLAAPLAVQLSVLTGTCVSGPYCGDGQVDPEEDCDDGNALNNDACTTFCKNAACGDGFTRVGVEQCDDGNAIGGDCCTNACAFGAPTTVCRAATGVCDLAENCSGNSGSCPADTRRTSVCRAASGTCDAAEVCDGTAATCPADKLKPTGTACDSDDNVCTNDLCNANGICAHVANTQPCNDGLFCNGSDTCSSGTCSLHAGNPCPGADSDGDCSESCSEEFDACTASDPNGSTCNDGSAATAVDQCQDGLCVGGGTGSLCGDADGNGRIQASDALRTLRAAVGEPVSCSPSRCDTDNNGTLQASDAFRVLRKAVGQPVDLTCPAS